jgi:2-dehydro-3-deoxyphosphogluconate aldolase/(4S)-4-hydroxy-2-oxoglutarate aldolase
VTPSTATATARLTEALAAVPLIAILRGERPDHLAAAGQVVLDAGIRVVEFPLTTPGALGVVHELRERRPDQLVGAGTVVTPADAEAAAAAGAQFLVAPGTRPDTLAVAARHGVPMLPGAFTATEVGTALEHGAALVKLFPATLGPAYLRALREPLPGARLVPTGGVGLDDIADFLRAGAAAVALGSALVGDALATGDLDALATRAARAVAASRR